MNLFICILSLLSASSLVANASMMCTIDEQQHSDKVSLFEILTSKDIFRSSHKFFGALCRVCFPSFPSPNVSMSSLDLDICEVQRMCKNNKALGYRGWVMKGVELNSKKKQWSELVKMYSCPSWTISHVLTLFKCVFVQLLLFCTVMNLLYDFLGVLLVTTVVFFVLVLCYCLIRIVVSSAYPVHSGAHQEHTIDNVDDTERQEPSQLGVHPDSGPNVESAPILESNSEPLLITEDKFPVPVLGESATQASDVITSESSSPPNQSLTGPPSGRNLETDSEMPSLCEIPRPQTPTFAVPPKSSSTGTVKKSSSTGTVKKSSTGTVKKSSTGTVKKSSSTGTVKKANSVTNTGQAKPRSIAPGKQDAGVVTIRHRLDPEWDSLSFNTVVEGEMEVFPLEVVTQDGALSSWCDLPSMGPGVTELDPTGVGVYMMAVYIKRNYHPKQLGFPGDALPYFLSVEKPSVEYWGKVVIP